MAAALPLFLQRGASVTTREIAEAAGIAEGTIFRVFDDKPALIEAIVDAAYDVERVERGIDAIDRELPLDQRVARAVDILVRRSEAIFKVTSALATIHRPETIMPRRPPQLRAIVRLLEPDAARLVCSPEKATRLLRGLVWAATSRMFSDGPVLTRAEIVDLFLHGVLAGAAGRCRVLIPLLRSHLRPYRRLLIWLAILQVGQVTATLLLPTLNADIIDQGVLKGDTAFIERMGAILLGITVIQVFLALGRHVLRGPDRDGLRPRPAPGAVPQRRRALGPRGAHVRCAVVGHPGHQRRAADPDARARDLLLRDRRAHHDPRRLRARGPRRRRRSRCSSSWPSRCSASSSP